MAADRISVETYCKCSSPGYTDFCILSRMKTTLDIDDALLVRAKAFAARGRTSLTAMIEDGLRLRLRAPPRRPPGKGIALTVFRGTGGLVRGVNPRSNRSLFDAADDT